MVEIKSTETEKIIYKPKSQRLPKSNQKLPQHSNIPGYAERPKTKNQERTEDALPWYVYILECNDNSLYTGVTNNLQKRMDTHAKGKGSKYVKAKGFKKLLRFKECKNKIDAQQKEYKIKQLPKSEKLSWFIQNK